MDSEQQMFCGNCNHKIQNLSGPCESCGSIKKNIVLELVDKFEFELKDCIDGKIINPSLRSKDKMREKFTLGASQSANGDWAEKTRIVNRDKDYYFEEVKNSKGEIIHHCTEKLSEHIGHGTDKFNNPNQQKNNYKNRKNLL